MKMEKTDGVVAGEGGGGAVVVGRVFPSTAGPVATGGVTTEATGAG
jgi:hypothetical protein